jgi:hypothetical protein
MVKKGSRGITQNALLLFQKCVGRNEETKIGRLNGTTIGESSISRLIGRTAIHYNYISAQLKVQYKIGNKREKRYMVKSTE